MCFDSKSFDKEITCPREKQLTVFCHIDNDEAPPHGTFDFFDHQVMAKNNGDGTFLVDVYGGMRIFKDDSKVDDDLGEWGTMCNSFLSEYNNKEVFEKYVAAWVVGLDNCEIWTDYKYNTSNNYPILFDPEPSTFDA